MQDFSLWWIACTIARAPVGVRGLFPIFSTLMLSLTRRPFASPVAPKARQNHIISKSWRNGLKHGISDPGSSGKIYTKLFLMHNMSPIPFLFSLCTRYSWGSTVASESPIFGVSTNQNRVINKVLSNNVPLSLILLYLRSREQSVLFVFSASPMAIAPSSAKPFHDRSNVLTVMFAFNPAHIPNAPCTSNGHSVFMQLWRVLN